jgi:regulatory protein
MAKTQKPTSKKEALVKAQNLCAYQEKCESDIRNKLYSWKTNPDDIDEVIEQLKKEQFIDEQRFAISFAKEKFRFNKWGKIKIEYALKQKNISSDFISNAMQEISETEYDSVLENELNKKWASLKESDEYTMKSKLIRFALSKGFENGKVFDMVSKIIKNNKKDFTR